MLGLPRIDSLVCCISLEHMGHWNDWLICPFGYLLSNCSRFLSARSAASVRLVPENMARWCYWFLFWKAVLLISECSFCWFDSSGGTENVACWRCWFSERIKGRNMLLYLENMGCCFAKSGDISGHCWLKLFHVQPLIASCGWWMPGCPLGCDFCSDL